jgi:hypothetical protein
MFAPASEPPHVGVAKDTGIRVADRPSCVPASGRTVLVGGHVTVYRVGKVELRVCNQAGVDELVSNGASDVFLPPVLRIRGDRVVYAQATAELDRESVDIVVLDLTDRRVRSVYAGGYTKIVSLRLAADGSVAWIDCPSSHFPPQLRNGRGTECYKAGRLASVAKATPVDTPSGFRLSVLDKGHAITPSSLRLSGRVLSWKNAGRRRSARL